MPFSLQSTENGIIRHIWRRVKGSASRGRREKESFIQLEVGSNIEKHGISLLIIRLRNGAGRMGGLSLSTIRGPGCIWRPVIRSRFNGGGVCNMISCIYDSEGYPLGYKLESSR